MKELSDLDISQSSQGIQTKIIKENSDTFASFKWESFSNMIDLSIFPAALKLVSCDSSFCKGSKNSKEKYRPVSILPNISKTYEKWMYK